MIISKVSIQYLLEVTYDRYTVIKGGRAYVFKKHKQDIFLSPMALLAVVVWGYYATEINVWYGALVTVAAVYFLLVYFMWLVNPLRSWGYWKKSGLKNAQFVFNEMGISMSSEIGVFNFSWSDIKSLWELDNYLIINYKTGAHTCIPILAASTEIKDYIRSKIDF